MRRATEADFALNGRLKLLTSHVGEEREPVLLIDGVMRDPQALVEAAAGEDFRPVFGPEGGYPGLRAPAPLAYVETLVRALQPTMAQAFGLGNVAPGRAECSFSLVTLRPDQLVPAQRIPHVDTVNPLQFALLHYLCDERFGGTAFYRHRATGFAALTEENLPEYEARRAEEEDLCAGYPLGDLDHFEELAAVDARFDRLVIYRSRLLHSGRIEAPELLSADPRRGRLTANVFVSFRPART